MRSASIRLVMIAVALGLPVAALAADPVPLVVEGDSVPGVGLVTRIDNVAINNNAIWFVEADTDNSDTSADSVLLKTGVLYLRENDILPLPPGATLDSFDSVIINNNDDSGFNFFLNSVLPSSEDSGVYFNDVLVIQESDISTAPEFTPGTPYIGFFDVKINHHNQFLLVASIDDPAISSSVDRALVRVSVSGTGALLSESVHAKEGDILPGQTEQVDDFGTGPHQSAINNAGQLMFFANLAGSTSTDGAIYLDFALLAQEGSPSPIAGRNYEFLSSRGMDLNNLGGYVHKAGLDGATSDDEVLIVNGAVFRREGDSFPAIAPFSLTSFGTGSGPVKIDDAGNVLWYGDWDDTNTDIDTGLFLNGTLLVQEGVTTIGGVLVDTISSGTDAFDMSDDGRYIIFEATLEGGINGAFLIEVATGENQPPVAVCRDVTVVADETCTADANVDDGSFDPDGNPITLSQSPPGPYPVGVNKVVTLTVTDDQGASDSCTGLVTVLDVVPPVIAVELDPDVLWPPNHRMIDIGASVAAMDLCSPTGVVLTSITSDEPDNGEGDGNTVDDIQDAEVGTADFEFGLRAERSGTGDGRVYTVTYTATDASGNEASATATVLVPHDQGGVVEPLNGAVEETAAGTVVQWNEVDHAQYYNIVRGSIDNVIQGESVIDLGLVKCIELHSQDTSTAGLEDNNVPAPGEAFFYVIEYVQGSHRSGYGTESAAAPRVVGSGACE
jgi:hypothetical protein